MVITNNLIADGPPDQSSKKIEGAARRIVETNIPVHDPYLRNQIGVFI